jgi:hypothetical protein
VTGKRPSLVIVTSDGHLFRPVAGIYLLVMAHIRAHHWYLLTSDNRCFLLVAGMYLQIKKLHNQNSFIDIMHP